MEDSEKRLFRKMMAGIVFSRKILEQAGQYTSKHCTDCMKNRYRSNRALTILDSLLDSLVRPICIKHRITMSPAERKKIKVKCREIEESSWKHQSCKKRTKIG